MEIVEIEGIKKIALLPHNQENIHYLCACVSFFLAQFVIIINIFILLFIFYYYFLNIQLFGKYLHMGIQFVAIILVICMPSQIQYYTVWRVQLLFECLSITQKYISRCIVVYKLVFQLFLQLFIFMPFQLTNQASFLVVVWWAFPWVLILHVVIQIYTTTIRMWSLLLPLL